MFALNRCPFTFNGGGGGGGGVTVPLPPLLHNDCALSRWSSTYVNNNNFCLYGAGRVNKSLYLDSCLFPSLFYNDPVPAVDMGLNGSINVILVTSARRTSTGAPSKARFLTLLTKTTVILNIVSPFIPLSQKHPPIIRIRIMRIIQ